MARQKVKGISISSANATGTANASSGYVLKADGSGGAAWGADSTVGGTPSFTTATISASDPVLNIARTGNYTYKIGSLANDTFAIQSNETTDSSYASLIEIDSYAHQGTGPALKIDSNGKVGIGKTPSTWYFDVDSSGTNVASFDGSNNTGVVINSSSSIADIIGYSNSASSYNALNIRGASGTGLVVDTSNNVGIRATPEAHYTGYSALDIGLVTSLFSSNSGTNVTTLTNNGFLNSNASQWTYKVTDEAMMYSQVNGDHRFSTAASGSADAAISWSEKVRFQAAGGISFNGDTAAANALDDYEEGSWTIGVSSSDPGSMSTTVSNGYGWYVKVGKLVTLGGSFDLSTSNPQGTMRITGLPYACSANGIRPLFVGSIGYTINIVPQPHLVTLGNGSAASYLDVWKQGNNSRYNVSDFNNGGRMNFQISYETA